MRESAEEGKQRISWPSIFETFGQMFGRWRRASKEPICLTPQVSPLRPKADEDSGPWSGAVKPHETLLTIRFRWSSSG